MNPACTRREASEPVVPFSAPATQGLSPGVFLPAEVLGSAHHCTESCLVQQGRHRAIWSAAASFKSLLCLLATVHRYTDEQGSVELG
jgi:hypothetical protein